MIISSQRFLDENIIEEKKLNEDYEVMLSPEFIIDGEKYQVILDGHHSLAAAISNGVDPEYWTADASDHDAIMILDDCEDPDEFLMAVHMGNDYYNVETGVDVW
jgi:hypothetical protein